MERALLGPGQGLSGSGSSLWRAVSRCTLRERVVRALGAATTAGVVAALAVALGHALHALGVPLPRELLPFGAAALVLGAGVLGALRGVDRLAIADRIDKSLHQPSLCASGLELLLREPSSLSAFERACVSRAERAAQEVDAGAAIPLRAPQALRWLVPAVLGALLSSQLSPPRRAPVLPAAGRPIAEPMLLHPEELLAFREESTRVPAVQLDPKTREAVAELQALLDALADRTISHEAALARLRKLERELDAQGLIDEHALLAALARLGQELSRAKESAELGKQLEAGSPEQAAAEMQALADRLEQEPLAEARRKELSKALERAAEPPKAGAASERLERELERLSRQEQNSGTTNGKQGSSARGSSPRSGAQQRELERLSREAEREQQAQRSLDALRRELAEAGSQLGQRQQKQPGSQRSQAEKQAEQALREAKRQLEQLAQQKGAAQQARELRERLAQLRAALGKRRGDREGDRKDDPTGAEAQAAGVRGLDLDRFAKLSRGQSDPQDDSRSEPTPLLAPASEARPGRPAQDGLAPLGQSLESSGEEQPDKPGEDRAAGVGGRPGQGDPTRLQASHETQRITGQEGQGPTRSEVIAEAGQRGFVSRGYQKVHTDYVRHAESVLERERVPAGYRFYVKRYFQLIRPRDEDAP